MAERLFLLRLSGELYTKARQTRLRFLRRLERNLRDALAAHAVPHHLERTWSRIYLRSPDPAAAEIAARVFGVQSVSEIVRRPWRDLAELIAAGREFFGDAVAGKRFAVRASRRARPGAGSGTGSGTGSGINQEAGRRSIPFDSHAVEVALGSALLPGSAGVDLDAPEVTAYVEVEPEVAHLFLAKVAGHGGLPLGVEGRAVALVSGGFDSAVAAWLLLKRGVRLDYVFYNLGGDPHRAGALAVLGVLAERFSYGTRPRVHEIDLRPWVAQLGERCDPQLWQLLLKRAMLRAAEEVARQSRAVALATGDAIGQVSSQTLQNLAVVSQATHLPVLRPLVGMNKEEILALARRIGVHDLAATVPEHCGLAARRPATRATLRPLLVEEGALDPDLLAAAIAERKVTGLRAAAAEQTPASPPDARPALETDAIAPGATVLDLRPAAAYLAWHYPGALHLDLPQALAACGSLPRERTYVLVCEVGWKSAHLAAQMRAAGLAAVHFRGGSPALMRLAERQHLVAPELLAPALREGAE